MSKPITLLAEMLGTMFLVLAVVGSGIMAQLLTTDVALQLLINAAATIAMLYLLINLLAPLSGAHFNPVVTMVQVMKKGISISSGIAYLASQVSGAILGSLLAHLLFDRQIIALSTLIGAAHISLLPRLWRHSDSSSSSSLIGRVSRSVNAPHSFRFGSARLTSSPRQHLLPTPL